MIRNTLPDKTGNPESLKNNHNNCKALLLISLQLARIC